MKSTDYTKGCEILATLSKLGSDIDKMSIPLEEKTVLISSLKQPYDVINLWLIRGRSEAENDKGEKVGFTKFLHNIKKLFYETKQSD